MIETKGTCRPSGAKCAGASLVGWVGEPNPYEFNPSGAKYTNTNSIPLGAKCTNGLSPSHFLTFSLPRFLSVLISVNLRPYFPKNLKPAMCLYRFIRGILVGDLPINSFFRFEPKNLAIRVKFFTKKLLTDV